MTEPDEVLLRKALTGAVADLADARRLTVVELALEGIVAWKLWRDPAGVPHGRARPVAPWHELYGGAIPPEQAVVRAARPADDPAVIVVSSFPDHIPSASALEWIRDVRPELQHFIYGARLPDLLREVIAHDPLTHLYELVTLRRTHSGRLELGCCLLFPVGAQRGATTELTVRCENNAEHGTVFAVVAASPHERLFRPVVVRSAKLSPGVYDLRAELRRPGMVRFLDLPSSSVRDDRPWADLVAAVPDRLEPPPAAAHLICAIEVSGRPDRPEQVTERISRAGQLITAAAGDLRDRLRVSLVSYGPHAFERNATDVPVTFLCWEGTSDEALAELRGLADRAAVTSGYPRAAQLECVLTQVADRLGPVPSGTRTALLAIGDRPPFPARVHESGILPCPRRHDWEAALHRLRDNRDMAFAAICDTSPEPTDRIWHELGGGPPALLDTADPRQVCRSLGLSPSAVQRVPFPLTETE